MRLLSALKALFLHPMPGGLKGRAELLYWLFQEKRQGGLGNQHYAYFFTTHFGLSRQDYVNKRVLDIGCGPRGSLEWVNEAHERVGLDPLAEAYRLLGVHKHQMQYVATGAEQIPFPDQHFDIISSFNSLDHVTDLPAAIAEIKRVLAPNGFFLLITDVGHKPTITEPWAFGFEIEDAFKPDFTPIRVQKFEKSQTAAIYASIRNAIPYDEHNLTPRYGVLSVLFRK